MRMEKVRHASFKNNLLRTGLVLALFTISLKSFATNYYVTSTADGSVTSPASGTLRYAINALNSGGSSSNNLYLQVNGTIKLIDALPDIVKRVTIDATTYNTILAG